jgi:hypothetical protein
MASTINTRHTVLLRLPDEVYLPVKAVADEHMRPVNSQFILILRDWIARQKRLGAKTKDGTNHG